MRETAIFDNLLIICTVPRRAKSRGRNSFFFFGCVHYTRARAYSCKTRCERFIFCPSFSYNMHICVHVDIFVFFLARTFSSFLTSFERFLLRRGRQPVGRLPLITTASLMSLRMRGDASCTCGFGQFAHNF